MLHLSYEVPTGPDYRQSQLMRTRDRQMTEKVDGRLLGEDRERSGERLAGEFFSEGVVDRSLMALGDHRPDASEQVLAESADAERPNGGDCFWDVATRQHPHQEIGGGFEARCS